MAAKRAADEDAAVVSVVADPDAGPAPVPKRPRGDGDDGGGDVDPAEARGSAAGPAREVYPRYRPPKRGQKDFAPRGTADEAAAIDAIYADLRLSLTDARHCHPRALSRAVWDAASATAVVTSVRGSHYATMGRTVQGRLHLLPEEALYLVDRGALALAVDDVPEVSVQHAHILAAAAGVTVTQYQVYAHLKRLGFIVNRTGASWHALPPPLAHHNPNDEAREEEEERQPQAGVASDTGGAGGAAARPVHPLALLIRAWERTRATAVGWLRRLVSAPGPTELVAPTEALAPPPPSAPPPPPSPPPPPPPPPAEVRPLFQPGTAQLTSEELYVRMRTLPTVVPAAAPATAAATDPRIVYDVYRPDRTFAKRAPPPVAFRVVIQTADAPPPDAHATVRLFAEAGGVPLKVAVVHGGSVIFYAWVNLRLPVVAMPLIPTERPATEDAPGHDDAGPTAPVPDPAPDAAGGAEVAAPDAQAMAVDADGTAGV